MPSCRLPRNLRRHNPAQRSGHCSGRGNATRRAGHAPAAARLGGDPGHRSGDQQEGLEEDHVRSRRASQERQGVGLGRHDPQGARDLRAQGVKIVGLSSGEPDFPTRRHAIEAAHKAAWPAIPNIRRKTAKPLKAIQHKFKRDNKLDYALDEIMVSNGSKQIMYDA